MTAMEPLCGYKFLLSLINFNSDVYIIAGQGRKADARVEMAAMGETARVLMETASKNDALFVPASHQDHIRPMFKVEWRE